MRTSVAARSVEATMPTEPSGMPACSAAAESTRAMAAHERAAIDPPRKMQAFPDFRQMPAASAVAYALKADSRLQGALLERAPERVGKLGEALERGGHVLDARIGEEQPVYEALLRALLAGGGHVGCVRLKNLGHAFVQRLRHGAQGAVALVVARLGQAHACRASPLGEHLNLFVHA